LSLPWHRLSDNLSGKVLGIAEFECQGVDDRSCFHLKRDRNPVRVVLGNLILYNQFTPDRSSGAYGFGTIG
jgi:hypothetical protein